METDEHASKNQRLGGKDQAGIFARSAPLDARGRAISDVLERIEHEQKFDGEDEHAHTKPMASREERLRQESAASEAECGEDDEDESESESLDEDESESESLSAAADADASAAEADASAAVAAESSVAVEEKDDVILTEEPSAQFQRSVDLLDVFERSLKELQRVGAVKAVGATQNAIHKEERRMRGVAREDPEILSALAQLRDKNCRA